MPWCGLIVIPTNRSLRREEEPGLREVEGIGAAARIRRSVLPERRNRAENRRLQALTRFDRWSLIDCSRDFSPIERANPVAATSFTIRPRLHLRAIPNRRGDQWSHPEGPCR